MTRHFSIRILAGKRPFDTAMPGITPLLPCIDLGDKCSLIRQSPIKALAIQDADFDFMLAPVE